MRAARSFQSGDQQDAQELLLILLDLVVTEAAKADMQRLGSGKVQRRSHYEEKITIMHRRGLSLGINKRGLRRFRELGLKCIKYVDIGGTCTMGTPPLNVSQQQPFQSQLSPLPSNPLRGSLASELVCGKCKTSKPLNISPFVCLPLPLPLNNPTSLKECLRLFSGPETVDGIKCSKCTLQDEILRSICNDERNLLL